MGDESNDIIVNIDKEKAGTDKVTLAVNGSIKNVPTGSDQPVSAAIAEALSNSHVAHRIVGPAGSATDGSDAGVAPEPSTTLDSTAIRDHAQDIDGTTSMSAEPQPLANEPEPVDIGGGVKLELPEGAGQPEAGEDTPPEPAATVEHPAVGGTVEDLKGIVAVTDSREELEKMLAAEKSGQNRSTALKLIQDKLASIE